MAMTSERRTLAAVQALLANPDLTDPGSELIQEMFAMGGLAQEAAALLSQAAEETIGGIMANAMSHMTWLKSSGMRLMLGSSDFSALDLNNGHTTVYFVMPPELMGVHKRALRLITGTFTRAAAKGRKAKGKRPTLFMLDEFAALGTMDSMPQQAAIARGRGMRIIFVVQTIGQLVQLYGKNWQTFFGNSGQVQVFAVNDVEGQEFIEKNLGPRVRWRKRTTKTKDGEQVDWEPTAAFSLRGAEEVGRAVGRSSGLQIVLNEGGHPFLLRRTPYTKMFKPGEYAPDPSEPGGESLRDKAWGVVRLARQKLLEWLL
jgi:type IV secretory pathway TraG/TraD family ATPase VirD4